MIHLGCLRLSSQQTYLAGVVMIFLQMNKLRLREAAYLLSVHSGWMVGLKWNRLDLKSLLFSLHQKSDTLCDVVSGLFQWHPGVSQVFGIETEAPVTKTFPGHLAGKRYNSTFLWFS